jgi:CRISPR-associated protein Cmr6
MSNTKPHLGYLFYQDYYRKFFRDFSVSKITEPSPTKELNKEFKKHFDALNKEILKYTITQRSPDSFMGKNQTREFETMYPGLVIGTGIGHGIKKVGEFKLGFYFDATTGEPIIPGSMLKGILRSVFPNVSNSKGVIRHKNISSENRNEKYNNIRKYFNKNEAEMPNDAIDKLELEIFEGYNSLTKKYIPTPKRDTFYDTFVFKGDKNNLVFESDAITPHTDEKTGKPAPLKNPRPLIFLKIRSGVRFKFDFDLTKSEQFDWIDEKVKMELFEKIIEDYGIGAKTNVGYGQLKAV